MTDSTQPQKHGCWIAFGGFVFMAVILKPLLVISYNTFLFLHKLFRGGTLVAFEVWWTLLGLLAGMALGAWVAAKRYQLAAKWIWYPIGGLAIYLFIFMLVNEV
ncbi:hypothetical protein [Chitinophaga rhizophila]|uniref:Uncharacterized protein n=1 Tax=Chitinophaga rhizophila TaxID=2866212 RepID=A0ABS7GKD5_9BACT|nr:hypothetical protein [Chitinophaga rhizophila]MBW8687107.1 hypothetical protein [Chitinophaga rhizophila]